MRSVRKKLTCNSERLSESIVNHHTKAGFVMNCCLWIKSTVTTLASFRKEWFVCEEITSLINISSTQEAWERITCRQHHSESRCRHTKSVDMCQSIWCKQISWLGAVSLQTICCIWICIITTRPLLYANEVRPTQHCRLTKVQSSCQIRQCCSKMTQDSVIAWPSVYCLPILERFEPKSSTANLPECGMFHCIEIRHCRIWCVCTIGLSKHKHTITNLSKVKGLKSFRGLSVSNFSCVAVNSAVSLECGTALVYL